MPPTRLSALIADDDDASRSQLAGALAMAWPELQVVADVTNGIDAWDAFLDREPPLCFLDVRMPGLTGVEVAKRIAGRAHVVFLTGPHERAVAALDAAGTQHLRKPIDASHLAEVVAELKARLAAMAPPAGLSPLLDRLIGQMRRPDYLHAIPAGMGIEVKLLPIDEVVYFEAESRYTRAVYSDGEALVRTPLKELLGQLDPARFWQIHRGFVVNPRHVAAVDGGAGSDAPMTVLLEGRAEKLPVSHHFQSLFRKR